MKAKNKTAFDLVKNQINCLHTRIYKLKLLASINNPKIIDSGGFKTIGDSCFVDKDKFEEVAQRIMDNEEYFIMFNDGGIINLAYTFDCSGKVLAHKLEFFSLFDSHVYLRIDYSSIRIENARISHPPIHLHTSITKDSFRLPVNIPVSPYSFLYLVLKYYYNDKSNFTNSLLEKTWKTFYDEDTLLLPFLHF